MGFRTRALAVAAAVALSLSGCGGTGQVEVEGDVSYDGQPIKAGSIAFIADGGPGPNGGAAIIDGKYRIPADIGPKPGRYKIDIRWAKPTGSSFKSESGEMVENTKEGLPDKYNVKTELREEVKAGKNVIHFNLPK